ncbi:MAG: DUF1684 domain-containing protein [Anaerolineales bacterium]|nr:DUF1684 domain-containing protein [Anaerolineales bacterium]
MSQLDQFRKMKDEFFRTDHHSPLTADQKRSFSGLNYFPENSDLDLHVEIQKFSEPETIQMQTTTGNVQTYLRYGRIQFDVDGQEAELTIFNNEHGYFLPFVDSLAGVETYGAGRYIEPERMADGRLHVDFNMAYNPYCAYNELYSCPLTPFENRLKVPIRAGEKIYKDQ